MKKISEDNASSADDLNLGTSSLYSVVGLLKILNPKLQTQLKLKKRNIT